MGAARYGLILTAIDLQKLELFGAEYIAQHFQRVSDEELYKSYMSNALKIIAENTSNYAGGYTLKHQYSELIEAKYDNTPKNTQTPEQIVNGIMERLKKI